MIAAERTVHAYLSRARADNWASWAKENPDDNWYLIQAVMGRTDGAE